MLCDVDGMENDARILREGSAEPLHFLHPERPCPCPELCDWTEGRTCGHCKRVRHPLRETADVQSLSAAVRGGVRLGPEDLSMIQWQILGDLNDRRDAYTAVARGVMG